MGVLVVVASSFVVAGLVFTLLPRNSIPASVRTQLTSTLLLPSGGGVVINLDLAKYDAPNKLLTFTVNYAGTVVVFSEQPTPDTFVDIPDAYNKLINGLDSYESFDTTLGTVHLTRPKKLNGKQMAVLSAKGTLLFAKATDTLTSDQWRQLCTRIDIAN